MSRPKIACPHWEPGKITFRTGCTACEAEAVARNDPQNVLAMLERAHKMSISGPDVPEDSTLYGIAAKTLRTLIEHNQYFRDSPNLAFYAQALRDQQKLEAIRAEVASQKAQDDMSQWGEHGRWSCANAIEQILDRVEPELPKSY